MPKHTPPSIRSRAFNCPHCGAFAAQTWYTVFLKEMTAVKVPDGVMGLESTTESVFSQFELSKTLSHELKSLHVACCQKCFQYSIWMNEEPLHPDFGTAPPPNEDLSDDIRADYEEASLVITKSPRSAAALLRLAVQKLCAELGVNRKSLNDAIAELVERGLDSSVQMALDSVRITGNAAVHPGEIDLRDDQEIVLNLFHLVNFIADEMLTRSKRAKEFYNTLPENTRKQIAIRDKKEVDK